MQGVIHVVFGQVLDLQLHRNSTCGIRTSSGLVVAHADVNYRKEQWREFGWWRCTSKIGLRGLEMLVKNCF